MYKTTSKELIASVSVEGDHILLVLNKTSDNISHVHKLTLKEAEVLLSNIESTIRILEEFKEEH